MRAPLVIDLREFAGGVCVFNKIDLVLHPTPLAPTRILNSLHDSIPGIPSRIPASDQYHLCQSVVTSCLSPITCDVGDSGDSISCAAQNPGPPTSPLLAWRGGKSPRLNLSS
jgi:hypothetical protein